MKMSVENNEREIHCNGHEILIGDEVVYQKEVDVYVTIRQRVKVSSSQPLRHEDAVYITEQLFDEDKLDYVEHGVITDAHVE